jgi:hypothetical protein
MRFLQYKLSEINSGTAHRVAPQVGAAAAAGVSLEPSGGDVVTGDTIIDEDAGGEGASLSLSVSCHSIAIYCVSMLSLTQGRRAMILPSYHMPNLSLVQPFFH